MVEHRHRDGMQRVVKFTEEDRYLSPWDGHLAKLVVQVSQEVYDGPLNSTWRRTFIRNVSPYFMHVANFPFSAVPADMSKWTDKDWTNIAIKWLPACIGLLLTVKVSARFRQNSVDVS
jgi:hypothetical protein